MTKSNENASKVNNSSHTSTPDCESVKSNLFNQLNLLPKQTENEQGIGNIDESDVVGNNLHGSDNNLQNVTQNNQTGSNITGTGHTINIYQCPQELTELLTKLMAK